MNELRIILLLAGLVIIGLLYVFHRRQKHDDEPAGEITRRLEPGFSEESVADNSSASARVSQSTSKIENPADALSDALPPDDVPQVDENNAEIEENVTPPLESTSIPVVTEKVVVLHMLPKAHEPFAGLEFIEALRAEGLQFGRFEIFHRFVSSEDSGPESPSLYSVANMVKPGSFNLRDLENQTFKGASMFLVLPGPEDPVAAFADMLATGRRLAATLDGQLVDSQGTHLSRQRASHMREDIINYQHGISAPGPTV